MSIHIFEEDGLESVDINEMFRGAPSVSTPIQEARVARFAEAVGRVARGQGSLRQIKEAMDSSQFQFYMGDLLQRRTYQKYMRMRDNWRPYVRIDNSIRDFRPVARYWMHGGAGAAPFLQENENYELDAVSGEGTQYQVAKYGKKFGITWEAIINDDLGLLRDFPDRLAESAVNTEDAFVARLYAQTGGPRTTVFANTASVSGSGLLQIRQPANRLAASSQFNTVADQQISLDSLRAAIQQIRTQVIPEDDDNLPIMTGPLHLIIPQDLEAAVRHLFSAYEIRMGVAGGDTRGAAVGRGSNQYEFRMNNDIPSMVRLHVNPWLDIVHGSAQNTAWYLIAYPGNSRPGLEVGRLRGYTTPQIFMRANDAMRIGGGMGRSSVNDGSFDKDTMEYKMRGVIGGVVRDRRMMLASAGTGSPP